MILTGNNKCYIADINKPIKETENIDEYKGDEFNEKIIMFREIDNRRNTPFKQSDFESYISEDNEKFEFKAINESELKKYQGLKNYSFCVFYPELDNRRQPQPSYEVFFYFDKKILNIESFTSENKCKKVFPRNNKFLQSIFSNIILKGKDPKTKLFIYNEKNKNEVGQLNLLELDLITKEKHYQDCFLYKYGGDDMIIFSFMRFRKIVSSGIKKAELI